MCLVCGSAHKSDEHQFQCSNSKNHDSLKCNCVRKCLNCACERAGLAKGHLVTDVSCPLRKRYRSADVRTGDTTDEEGRIAHASGGEAAPIDVDMSLTNV